MLLIAVLLAGCYTSRPMTVEVRDAETRVGVPDAVIIVRALNFFDTTPPGDFVHPSPGRSVWGRTDSQGIARLDDAVCPGHIVIVAVGEPPHSLSYEVHPGDTGEATAWLDAHAPGDGGPVTLQVRLGP